MQINEYVTNKFAMKSLTCMHQHEKRGGNGKKNKERQKWHDYVENVIKETKPILWVITKY